MSFRDLNAVLIGVFAVILLNAGTCEQNGNENVTLLAHVNTHPATGYNDCWGYTAPDGREYALLGVKNGTSIIDITDTANAQEVAFIASSRSDWKDIKTYQHYAYAVNETGGGLQIIDLSNLPSSASLVGTYTGFSTSHNIYIDTDNAILYAEGDFSAPVRVLSLADPENPVELASFGEECHDIYVQNNLAFVSEGNQRSVGIYNLSDQANPAFVNRIEIPSAGYVHNSWLSEDGSFLMTTEETSGKTVKLWDVRDITNIELRGEYLGPNRLAHNAHLKGHYAYISHYASGLRIVDFSNPDSLKEVGSYDTADAWGAFPFFGSGKILISDIEEGLYVVKFEPAIL